MNAREPIEAVVQRVLSARPAEVFDEWLDPAALSEWMCPRPARPTHVEVDATVGGRYRFDIEELGTSFAVFGRYLVVDRPHRLVFTSLCTTWPAASTESVVTVLFEPHGDEHTLMTIHHRDLPDGEVTRHAAGWGAIAAQLEQRIASGERSA